MVHDAPNIGYVQFPISNVSRNVAINSISRIYEGPIDGPQDAVLVSELVTFALTYISRNL